MNEFTFAGRSPELQKLLTQFEHTEKGRFSISMIMGESGAGKTALANEFLQRLKNGNVTFVHSIGFSNPHSGQGEPYLPFRQALSNLFENIDASRETIVGDTSSVAAQVAKRVFKSLIISAPELIEQFVPGGKIVNMIGQQVADEIKNHSKPINNPSVQSQGLNIDKIYEQYTHLLKSLSNEQPIVIVLDDMQWCDTASANLLFHLARSLDKSRVMLVCIYRNTTIVMGRNGEKHPLEPVLSEIKRTFGNVWIDLDAASAEQRLAFVNELVDSEPNKLNKRFRAELFSHTDGHALFTSELLSCLKMNSSLICDSDGDWVATDELDLHHSPEKMEGIIESRLGLLDDNLRTILTMASVQGFQFILQVITRLKEMNERESLQGWSKDLSKKHLLITESKSVRGSKGILSFFRFSSSVFQQYLYSQMGESERMQLHGDVAEILEEMYLGKEDEIVFELARHYDLALMPEKAVPYLYKAGRKALLLSAYTEAKIQLHRAAELAETLSDEDIPKKLEADIWLYLAHSIRALSGWNDPEAQSLYQKVRSRCEDTEEKDKLLEVLFGLWSIELVSGKLTEALKTATSMQEPAQDLHDPITEIRAAISLGNTHFWLGNLDEVVEISQKIKSLRLLTNSKEYLARTGYDASAIANQFYSWALALQGDIDSAKALCAEAIKINETIQHAFSQAIALTTGAFLYCLIGHPEEALNHSEKLIALAEKNGFDSYRGLGLMCKGWAVVMLKQSDSINDIEVGYQIWVKYSGCMVGSFKSLLLAGALNTLGQTENAQFEVEQGLHYAKSTGEVVMVPLLNSLQCNLFHN